MAEYAENRSPAPPTGVENPLVGTRYANLGRIGCGATGEVYLVRHLEMGRLLVAKVLRREVHSSAALVRRARAEARMLGALRHPNVVEITDFDLTPAGLPFIVMERLTGSTLATELARGLPDPKTAFCWMRQLLDALGAAHGLGLLHRDIKPSNVFLHHPEGGEEILKLLDFGLAKVQARPRVLVTVMDHSVTTGTLLGSPRFMSPEQVRGEELDPRSDLYSCGGVLYTLVAGRVPFPPVGKGSSPRPSLPSFAEAPPPPSTAALAAWPPAIDEVVLRALAPNPDDRFPDAAAFAAALEAVLSSGTPPASVEVPEPPLSGGARRAIDPSEVATHTASVPHPALHQASRGHGGSQATLGSSARAGWRRVIRWLPPPAALAALLVASVTALAGYAASSWLLWAATR